MESCEVIIVGGGLAGLTAAIHLSQLGHQVTLFEKNTYPKHKVCGEYISNEVIPYLNSLKLNLGELHPTNITKLHFSTATGKNLTAVLPLGGFGVSRYALDNFLFEKAVANGCQIIQQNVENVAFENDYFTIVTAEDTKFQSKIVLGAFGKRSSIDQKMHRDFISQKSPWLAVKAHYKGIFPNDVVGLHNFKGGYCGVSKVENDVINICYLADYGTFKNYKNIEEYQSAVVAKNPNLNSILSKTTLVSEKPLTISQVSFAEKHAVDNHILMIGDTAGLIHPLCGNGMAMAIHSAKIASELVSKYLKKELPSREILENQYTAEWNYNFKKRLRTGRWLAALLEKPKLSEATLRILTAFPFLLPIIINKTHGKPITL
ncbi:NAD(P)/FAD-dependent oxidoreductase [Flavobacterium wongokense]|uniref:NAD(P)/FAD-dependent oxidoreductase n=1 Tax=Flavobacterium wongokense TaxID=2910674 RepID=UPI001F428291|nr:NAD(P)/FAD-dependent oxidoreductase [Flavobacterium sp. WG47]MCF6133409.1 NAD(P)/FAD-dependent oxidoreductase [Flavobacterium sp. WG47]